MNKPLVKRFGITLVAAIVVVFVILGVWFHHIMALKAEFSKPQPAPTVTATEAKASDWTPFIQAIGTLQAVNGVYVTPKASGQVDKILFKSGQMVTQGQILLQLSRSTLLPQLKKAEAAAHLAQIDYNRQLKLKQQNAVPESELDKARSTLEQNQAEVAQLKAQINNTNVRAPFSGRIGIRMVSLGQYVQPGAKIASLQTINPIYVNFEIPDNQINQVHVGQTVQLQVGAYKNKTFTGKVTAIDPSVSSNTKSVKVQATLPNKEKLLVPGMFVTLKLLLPTQNSVVTVPQTAVNYTLYGNSVYVVSGPDKVCKADTCARERAVTVGQERHGMVQIIKGLKAGEKVVTTGQMKINNNSPIQVVKDVTETPAQ